MSVCIGVYVSNFLCSLSHSIICHSKSKSAIAQQVTIILPPRRFIRQCVVGLLDGKEVFVTTALVGVVLEGHLTICLLNLCNGGISADTEHFVVRPSLRVALGWRASFALLLAIGLAPLLLLLILRPRRAPVMRIAPSCVASGLLGTGSIE